MRLTESQIARLEEVTARKREVEHQLSVVDYSNFEALTALQREFVELSELTTLYEKYKYLLNNLEELDELAENVEFEKLVEEEREIVLTQLLDCYKKLTNLLVPEEPDDKKNVFLEIRAGAGGDEASIFAGDLFRCYQKFCESKGWSVDIVDFNPNPVGGYKEIIAFIKGDKVYKFLKFEKGVHRVQRIPKTEASGRIHTSTVTVAVLPEIEEQEIIIDPKDLKIETFRASGAGGQYVNTTDSAVRITHIPSGIVVAIQDERSQHKNREKAMNVLRARLYEKQKQEIESSLKEERKTQVGSGERAEKIRTYNYLQNRVTDHRLGQSWHNLDRIMEGELAEVIEALQEKFAR
ncbi:MAG: peptide chain release factor 1 [Deltaproteobacteria bacterium]|nr:peptide chain release factor 1 [Deltaproteobacteria bacterium]